MRVAIFSDVHGNLTALEAVLADIAREKPDIIFCAGDLCVFGPRPAACLQRIRAEEIISVYGNTDQWISNDPLLSRDITAEKRERREDVYTAAEWTWARLDAMERAWLRTLPFHGRVSPTVNARDDLFIVHANPLDVEQPILPPESVQEQFYGEVKQTDEDLRFLLDELATGILCFGHLHIPNVRRWGDMTLANISSVSLPLDGNSQAKYGLLTWDGDWTLEHRRIDYDIDREIKCLTDLKPPEWQRHANQLKYGRLD
jgi:predicted phosphodiesterase